MKNLQLFCRQVRNRSEEHRRAVQVLQSSALFGQVVSVLRQELDSLIRVIFLLAIKDAEYRADLILASVEGRQWTRQGKRARITEKGATLCNFTSFKDVKMSRVVPS
jgi:hypothetical protein